MNPISNQIVGRIHNSAGGHGFAALNSIGRNLADNTPLYSQPQQAAPTSQCCQFDLVALRTLLRDEEKRARTIRYQRDLDVAMAISNWYQENQHVLGCEMPDLASIISRVPFSVNE